MVANWFDNSLVSGQSLIDRFTAIATALGLKAPLASPTFTGTVTAPTFVGALTGNASTATSAATLTTPRTINGTSFNGSANITVSASTTNTLTLGSGLTGTSFNGASAVTATVDATALNTVSKIVSRDAGGNFAAGTVTATLSGNASTATSAATLTTARTINGTSFNGSANITITAANPAALTRGTYLTGTNYDGSAAATWAVDATDLNTASKVVARDSSGNFAAGAITANRFVTAAGSTLTIAAGVVTVTTGYHALDTEAAAATDDLDTINGGVAGMMLILRAASSVRDVVAKKGTGNLRLASDFTLTHTDDRLTLLFDGVNWNELCRSDNGV